VNTPRLLLDTHLLYWWMTADAKLGAATANLIAEGNIAISVVSLWEMLLKNRKGKLPLPDTPLAASIESQGFATLSLQARHLEAAHSLHIGHNDPFDHLLVATAGIEGCIFLTRDKAILAAGIPHVRAA
jgi:PIN domain nuclease of toxin-antitoxin system